MNSEIIMITDRSGSMEKLKADVIGNYNHFIDTQIKQGKQEAMVTHVLFGSKVQELYAGLPLFAVPRLTPGTYQIEGMTAFVEKRKANFTNR